MCRKRGLSNLADAHAEIALHRLFIGLDLGGGALKCDLPLAQDVGVVTPAQYAACVLLDDDQRDALRTEGLLGAKDFGYIVGESPALGSSSNMCVGRVSQPMAMASICRSPPLSWPARWSWRAARMGKSS